MKNENGYKVLITNAKFTKIDKKIKKTCPEFVTIDIPEYILKHINNYNLFKDEVETFVYDLLTKKYGQECNACQIWLPEENQPDMFAA